MELRNGNISTYWKHITCIILIEMHVLHNLCVDSLLTSTYLNNHLPSSPLVSTIPLLNHSPMLRFLFIGPSSFCLHWDFSKTMSSLIFNCTSISQWHIHWLSTHIRVVSSISQKCLNKSPSKASPSMRTLSSSLLPHYHRAFRMLYLNLTL